MINRIVKSSVPQQVFDILRKEIVNGTYPIGSKLPSENELVEMLGVSRPSIKSAIHQLAFMGMVETKAGDGTYVKNFSTGEYLSKVIDFAIEPENEDELVEYRVQMEINNAILAMRHATEEDFREMYRILDLMAISYADKNIEEHSKYDFQLHYQICKATHNRYFKFLFEAFEDIAYMQIFEKNKGFFMKAQTPDVHRDLIDAIKNKDQNKVSEIYRFKFKQKIND